MEEKELLKKAICFASAKHMNQTRKDGTPYIYHPLKIADAVKELGYGIKYQIVAILHDVLEDSDATEADLQLFGEDVVEAVKLLTRLQGMDEKDYVNAILKNHMAAVVKNIDKINNLYDVAYCGNKKWGLKYVEKSVRYYEGKFSEALDQTIIFARRGLEQDEPIKTCFGCRIDAMKLYGE